MSLGGCGQVGVGRCGWEGVGGGVAGWVFGGVGVGRILGGVSWEPLLSPSLVPSLFLYFPLFFTGAQLKSSHNIRLLCGSPLGLCHQKTAPLHSTAIPHPEKLQTAMSLYSNKLSCMVLMLGRDISNPTGVEASESMPHAHMHTCTHAHTHTCTLTHMHMHACTHAHMHTRTHAHMHTHTHAHARMHACIHAHMHTCTHVQRLLSEQPEFPL